jgi:ketosteroid isomerase-like protein
MKTAFCGVLGLLIALGVATAQQKSASADEAALRAIEEKWDAATLKGDAAALATICADGFITTDTEGKVRSKAEALARVKSGAVKFQSAKADDLKFAIYGDAAVVMGRWKGKFVENGKTVDATERISDFFIRQNGEWRCVASHASTLK